MSMEQFFFIFGDKELNKIYEEYLRRNMAWENFGFYTEVESYRKLPEKQYQTKAEEIFSKFIEVDSPNELGDITFSIREDIRNSLANPSKEIFNELCDIVVDSLANATITDFLSDPLYISHVNKQLFSKKEMSNANQSSCICSSKFLSCIF